MVMLGAGAPFIQVTKEHMEQAIRELFAGKGEKVVEINLKAFRAGMDVAGEKID